MYRVLCIDCHSHFSLFVSIFYTDHCFISMSMHTFCHRGNNSKFLQAIRYQRIKLSIVSKFRESNLYFKFKNTNYDRFEKEEVRNMVEKNRRIFFWGTLVDSVLERSVGFCNWEKLRTDNRARVRWMEEKMAFWRCNESIGVVSCA